MGGKKGGVGGGVFKRNGDLRTKHKLGRLREAN